MYYFGYFFNSNRREKFMKKFDIIIIIAILAVGLGLYFSGVFTPDDEGKYAVVITDDTEYARLPLDEDTQIRVETEYGYNDIVIEDGYADCVDADCRDGVCVDHKPVNMKGETIVCLPHKVIIKIV